LARRRFRQQVDRRKGRKRVPAPTLGWLAAELYPLVGFTPRTVREYVRRGFLTRPVFRGRATRYQRQQVIRLLAIKLLRAEHFNIHANTMLAHLERFNPEELEAWVLARPMSAHIREALAQDALARGAGTATSPSAAASPALAFQAQPPIAAVKYPTLSDAGWEHSPLLPGLQLSLRSDAGSAAQKAFEHLQTEFRAFMDRSIA
jgi:DNA-binding transcriptional MerR regulator